jgi:hypothetical protein
MKRKILLALLVLFTIAGCKKDTDKKENCRVTKLTRNGTSVYDIKYGDNEKISSIELSPGNEKYAYKYQGDKVTITFTKNGSFEYRLIVTNNKNGFATNVLMEDNESGSIWANQRFTYEGTRLVSNTVTDSDGNDSAVTNYIWEDGNPAVQIYDGYTFNYEYYTDKNYQPGDYRYINQLIVGYKTFEYKNLYKSSQGSYTTYFTYNFDDAGRIISTTGTSPNVTTTFQIEYDCK